jgi:hypothetical protein
MERITTLANRLAEAILFDWDKEEVIKLAKEVAVACHESIEFISLVRRMREAQKDVIYKSIFSALDSARPTAYEVAKTKQIILEQEVDEYLKKMEE